MELSDMFDPKPLDTFDKIVGKHINWCKAAEDAKANANTLF